LLVKAGKLTVIFPARKTCHFFRIYFSGIPILGILVPHPKPNRKTEPYSGEVPFHIAVILTLSEAERGRGPAFARGAFAAYSAPQARRDLLHQPNIK
jgi:hypothetical protein